MKTINKILLAFLLLPVMMLKAQVPPTGEARKVSEAVIKLFDGIAALDFDKIRENSTNDVLILESGMIWTLDSLTTHLEPLRRMNFKRKNDLAFIRSDVKGNIAWVVYNNTADMMINGQQRKVRWLESAVLVKQAQGWKVKLLHSTTVP